MATAPFVGEEHVAVVLPEGGPTIAATTALFELERAEFEVELGAPALFTATDPGTGPRWLLRLESERMAPPAVEFRHEEQLIVSCAADEEGLLETISLWRTLRRLGARTIEARDCDDLECAIERVVSEVADTYPAFALRRLDWSQICEQHVDAIRAAGEPLRAFQAWVAELEDAHTFIRPARAPGNLPYVVRVAPDAATFVRVPRGTSGYSAGARAGWRLLALDDAAVDPVEWLRRTGAPPRARPYIAGRRLLAGEIGRTRSLVAASPAGRHVRWQESPELVPFPKLVSFRRLASGAGYVRIEAWLPSAEADLDAALDELRACPRLILDLRANPGGNLVLAAGTRDRFLRRETDLGTIRYSAGGGGLSRPFPLVGEPPERARRWPGELVVLTDPLTYSASEDFLLGLQGLEHVRVVGEASGGGSGRPRTVRLVSPLVLNVSTALTYDRDGHCIEGAGVPVDIAVPTMDGDDGDRALSVAERC